LFATLAKFVTRHWAVVLAAWTAALVTMFLIAPSNNSIINQDDSAFLPETVPSRQAVSSIQSNFDMPPSLSNASVVMERPTGLTGSPGTSSQPAGEDTDWGFIARLTVILKERASMSNWTMMSPADPAQDYLRTYLASADGQAAVIRVDLPGSFASREAFEAVEWLERAVTQAKPPAGLDVAVTGSASYGRGATNASETSLKRTTWICIIAIGLILLITYRALPAAGISLATVTVAVIVSVMIVAIGGAHGWSISVLVQVFTVVVGYGAGTDFSLFFLARYHEELARHGGASTSSRQEALIRAMVGAGPAIVGAAATVAAGLSLMYFAQFRVFQTAGPAVAISIILACIASLSLTPALAFLLGPRTFWPQHITIDPTKANSPDGFWDRIATFTVRRRAMIVLLGLVILIPLAASSLLEEKVYDTLAALPETDPAVRGAAIYRRHFAIGEMSPVQILVQFDRPLSEADWATVALAVDRKLHDMPQVRQVRSLAHPLGFQGPVITPAEVSWLMGSDRGSTAPAGGRFQPQAVSNFLRSTSGTLAQKLRQFKDTKKMFHDEVLPRHVGRQRKAGLWEVALPWSPFSIQAMDSINLLTQAVRGAVNDVPVSAGASPRVLLAGDTAMMNDIRRITTHDFWFVGALAVITILFIVTFLIRDVLVALFVMLATFLSYGAAISLTAWIFHLAFGTVGLDWKVNLSLFVILVAVGQDYNLFMLRRIVEERRTQPLLPAVHAAVARTGSIISYCGLVMAATLGSLASSPLRLLQELGVAFIIGLLIDTFLVRPLMVPAFILVFNRMNQARSTPP